MTGRSIWIDPSFGASGDMLLGTLVGLGASLATIIEALDTLEIDGWSMTESSTMRGALSATRVDVGAASHEHGRQWSNIDRLIADAALPEAVQAGARTTFLRLGQIEAEAHGVSINDVHFHEVGAVDAIIDIVGVWIAIHLLALDSIIVGPIGLGHGTVNGAHGILPLPAPATAALLAGATVRSLDVAMETCTPTGAALLATIGTWGPLPPGVLLGSARGAGGRNPDTHPNVVTGYLIDTTSTPVEDRVPAQATVIIETNLDDVTPEVLGFVVDRLLTEGADDAWITPIVMKKGRPAHQLSALTSPTRAANLREIISRETGSLGIRQIDAAKYPLERSIGAVMLEGHQVRIKIGPHGAKPEHDDLVALAHHTGEPLRLLAMQALAVWRDIS